MGMDLIAQNPSREDAEHFHANWTGWGVLGDLLEDCGADLSEMAGSNDGDVVSAATAIAWADALDTQMDNLIAVEVDDGTYRGGKRRHLRVLSAQIANPTSSVEPMDVFFASTEGPLGEGARERVEKLAAVVPTVQDVDADEIEWLRRFSMFLRHSGGFAQF